jgi:hypothetical protein
MKVDSMNKTILLTALIIALPLTGCEQATQQAGDLANQSIDSAKKTAAEALGLNAEGSKDETGKDDEDKDEAGKDDEDKDEAGKDDEDKDEAGKDDEGAKEKN